MNPVPKEVTLSREETAWQLRQEHWTHAQIAAELGVRVSTVTKMLARVRARRTEALKERVEEEAILQLDRLDHIEAESMAAWERSKLPAETVTTKNTTVAGFDVAPDPDPDAEADSSAEILAAPPIGSALENLPAVETTLRVEGQTGNPAYLGEARAAMADKRKILGIGIKGKDEDDAALIKVIIGVDWEKI